MRPDGLRERVAALVAHFERVQAERMGGIPLLNAALRVEAVGFAWNDDADPAPPLAVNAGGGAPIPPPEPDAARVAEGVLITPWFMSLWRLPAEHLPYSGRGGRSVARDFGGESFDFMIAFDPAIGYHESCALFSPMHEFDSQERARDTALAVLAQLRLTPKVPTSAARPEAVPARRAFLFRGLA
jgi:[NiFe] hydrogenase assembly HybE family chaperone